MFKSSTSALLHCRIKTENCKRKRFSKFWLPFQCVLFETYLTLYFTPRIGTCMYLFYLPVYAIVHLYIPFYAPVYCILSLQVSEAMHSPSMHSPSSTSLQDPAYSTASGFYTNAKYIVVYFTDIIHKTSIVIRSICSVSQTCMSKCPFRY